MQTESRPGRNGDRQDEQDLQDGRAALRGGKMNLHPLIELVSLSYKFCFSGLRALCYVTLHEWRIMANLERLV